MAFDAKRSVYELAIEIAGKVNGSFTSAAAKTRSEIDSLGGSSRGTSAYVSDLTGSLSKLKIAAMAASAAVAVGKGLWNLGKAAVNAASEMETYRVTLNTVLQDEEKAGKMMAWATEFAATTPFNTGDIVDAVTKLEAYGFKSQAVLERIGNMASAMDKDLATAVEAVYKATRGEMELMENNFAIDKKAIREASMEWYGEEAVNAKGAIQNAELYNTTLMRMIEERFAGGMEKQSKTWEGLKSNMEDSKDAILRKIAGMDEEGNVIKGGLYSKVLTIGNAMAAWIDKAKDSELITAAGSFLSSVVGGVEKLVSGMSDVVDYANDFVRTLTGGKDIAEVLAAILGGTGNVIEGAATVVGETLSGNPSAALDAAASTIDGAIDDLVAAVEGTPGMLTALNEGRHRDNERVGEAIDDFVENKTSAIQGKSWWEGVKAFFGFGPSAPQLKSFSTSSTGTRSEGTSVTAVPKSDNPQTISISLSVNAGIAPEEFAEFIAAEAGRAVENAAHEYNRRSLQGSSVFA